MILVEFESMGIETADDDIITGFGTGFDDSMVDVSIEVLSSAIGAAGAGAFGAEAAGAGEGDEETSSPL